MAKNESKVADVISASNEILAQNQGKMGYDAWRAALTEKVGAHENALKHMIKNNLILFWLEGFNADMTPKMHVVNDKALITATTPLVESKIGKVGE